MKNFSMNWGSVEGLMNIFTNTAFTTDPLPLYILCISTYFLNYVLKIYLHLLYLDALVDIMPLPAPPRICQRRVGGFIDNITGTEEVGVGSNGRNG
jgi:hypothetical protein